jgi:hypothetical protein
MMASFLQSTRYEPYAPLRQHLQQQREKMAEAVRVFSAGNPPQHAGRRRIAVVEMPPECSSQAVFDAALGAIS